MSRAVKPDIVPLVRHLCFSLQPYAQSRKVEIIFINNNRRIAFDYQPAEIIHCLSQLLCRIISYLPASSTVNISTCIVHNDGGKCFRVTICNTAINLSKIKEITNNIRPAVNVETRGAKGTIFIYELPVTTIKDRPIAVSAPKTNVQHSPEFFEEVRKRLQHHFSRTNGYLENLTTVHPAKAAFLAKINQFIIKNLADENFDVITLGKEMSMSRTQLFRKLKPIISQAPASYIKSLRLQKAKELLEASDLLVSEVAYKTGFKTPSHFTKVFTEKFGICPSYLATSKAHVTNR